MIQQIKFKVSSEAFNNAYFRERFDISAKYLLNEKGVYFPAGNANPSTNEVIYTFESPIPVNISLDDVLNYSPGLKSYFVNPDTYSIFTDTAVTGTQETAKDIAVGAAGIGFGFMLWYGFIAYLALKWSKK